MAKGLSRMAKPKVGVWSVRRFRRSLRRNGFKTRNVNYRIFVYQTHTWVIQGVFMEQEQAIDELRSTSSDQEASEIKYAKTMNISKLWISRNLPASYLSPLWTSCMILGCFEMPKAWTITWYHLFCMIQPCWNLEILSLHVQLGTMTGAEAILENCPYFILHPSLHNYLLLQ